MGHGKDVPCVVCGGDVAGTVWVLCSACEVPAHKACWDARGTCPVFACGSRETVDPAAAIFRKKAVVASPAAPPAVPGEADALQLARTALQDRQARFFLAGLKGWIVSLLIASTYPSFYMFGAAWFLAFLMGAGGLELRGWQLSRKLRDLEKAQSAR